MSTTTGFNFLSPLTDDTQRRCWLFVSFMAEGLLDHVIARGNDGQTVSLQRQPGAAEELVDQASRTMTIRFDYPIIARNAARS